MKRLTVDLGERSYPIFIGAGLLAEPGLLNPYIPGAQVMIVTNSTVGPLYLPHLLRGLTGHQPDVIELPDGEAFKTLDSWRRILDELMHRRHNRSTALIALGGGVVGDIAGFAAAAFARGVAFIQAPTTLLSQVDSSVGGKTGVNHPDGKNMIGAFHQPRCVLIDTSLLASLPDREYRAGLAEVVKYGVIRRAEFFDWLQANADALSRRDASALVEAIEKSCRIKAEVVAADERESGQRAILNFGHTYAHALETVTGYQRLLHGEAVAIGMVLAADCGARHGLCDTAVRDAIKGLLQTLHLPVQAPAGLDSQALLAAMQMDKKNVDGHLRLVLPERLGRVRITSEVDSDLILDSWRQEA